VSLAAALCATAATPALAQLAPNPNTPALVAAANGNPQLQSTASYVGALCPNLAAGTDLRLRCAAALGASVANPPLATTALDQITPQELLAQTAVIDGAISTGTSAVAGRLAALSQVGFGRGIASAYRPVVLASAADTAGLGGASVPPLQAFVNVVIGGGDKDRDPLESGYDFDQRSISGGVDYRFSDTFTAGVALSYGDTDLDFDAQGGSLEAETLVGSVYALWTLTPQLQLTGLVAYGQIDFTSDRTINYAENATSTISRVAHGKTEGDQWEGTLTLSYAMDGKDGWSYGPSFAVSARTLDLDAFDETGANGLNLSFPDQSADSLQLIAGFDISKAISTQGGVISPYARVQGIYETKDDSRAVRIRYVADTTGFFQGIRLTTRAPDRTRFLVGGGLAGQFANGWSGFADAETLIGLRDTTSYAFTLGLRKEF
jgi:uncharacterized protein YhjY with autotransporter beta-barrel domain